jgi:Protein of unknown function (DUF2950)
MRIALWVTSAVGGIAIALSGCSGAESPAKAGQQTFTSADSAAMALARAVIANDTTALLSIFGSESRPLILPSDHVQAERDRQVVTTALQERWWIQDGDSGSKVVVMGNESWPFPIPLVEDKGAWRFDTKAGAEEILYRRVGQNELAVMKVAAAFVEAQREYASKGRDGQPAGTYAQRFVSQDGRHNGLYWPVSNADPVPSPMGQLAARAAADGYRRADAREAYYGYYFKVLTSQGPHAPGGAKSYIANGAMRGGFAMVAWPADYGESGVMTFLIGKDGVLREKDLGPDTATLAPAIEAFDPDSTWKAP